jgi:hypothetical protein
MADGKIINHHGHEGNTKEKYSIMVSFVRLRDLRGSSFCCELSAVSRIRSSGDPRPVTSSC